MKAGEDGRDSVGQIKHEALIIERRIGHSDHTQMSEMLASDLPRKQSQLMDTIGKLVPDATDQAELLRVITEFVGVYSGIQLMQYRQAVADVRTGNARRVRAEDPLAKAVYTAVVDERGLGPIDRSSKEAGAILSAVNARLKRDGFEPVKVDVVRRVLEKFPRSSRAR